MTILDIIEVQGYTLKKLCDACPELYDIHHPDGQYLGYMRLRNGHFRVEVYDNIVYRATPKGDGIFEWDEREYFLNEAVQAVDAYLRSEV